MNWPLVTLLAQRQMARVPIYTIAQYLMRVGVAGGFWLNVYSEKTNVCILQSVSSDGGLLKVSLNQFAPIFFLNSTII